MADAKIETTSTKSSLKATVIVFKSSNFCSAFILFYLTSH